MIRLMRMMKGRVERRRWMGRVERWREREEREGIIK